MLHGGMCVAGMTTRGKGEVGKVLWRVRGAPEGGDVSTEGCTAE